MVDHSRKAPIIRRWLNEFRRRPRSTKGEQAKARARALLCEIRAEYEAAGQAGDFEDVFGDIYHTAFGNDRTASQFSARITVGDDLRSDNRFFESLDRKAEKRWAYRQQAAGEGEVPPA